ncbi:MAG: penicillin-binding protein 2 [Phenylobacterium sp.]
MTVAEPLLQAPPRRRSFAAAFSLERALERARTSDRAEDDTRIRIFFVLALFACAFVTLAVGATGAALFSGRNKAALGPPAAAERADLVDRNGRMLAADLLHYGVYVDPFEVWDTAETRRALLSVLPQMSPHRLDKVLRSGKRGFIFGGLTPEQKDKVHDLGLPGVSFEPEQRRVYPLGTTAAHLIGFSDTGGEGLSGAEFALNEAVRGGKPGQSVPLSIDLRIQAALEEELYKAAQSLQVKDAVGIITNVHTGEVLAIASYPTYDPNAPGKASPDGLVNRAAASVYEMGSTMKVFSVAMGLDSGAVNLGSMIDASTPLRMSGRSVRDYHAENRAMTVAEVFMHSSNIGTSRIALMAGGDTMLKYYKAFGLLEPAPIELRESSRPIVPRQWDSNTIASASFGHAISVSPLMVAAGMGAVLNGGTYVPLTIRPVKAGERPEGRRVVSEATSKAMLDLMRANVVHGTGGKANAPGLRVGGKTGSAEKAGRGGYQRDKLVSSFAAVFPTDGPVEADRYFVLILMDEPHGNKETFGFATGGWTAAPAVGKVIDRIGPILGVARRADVVEPSMGVSETVSGGEH